MRGTNNIVSAAQQSGSVKHLVYSTVGLMANIKQTQLWDANPFAKVYWENKFAGEAAVRSSGLPYYTILRPMEFMSNFILPLASFQFPDMATTGVVSSFWSYFVPSVAGLSVWNYLKGHVQKNRPGITPVSRWSIYKG